MADKQASEAQQQCEVRVNANAACDVCGAYGAFQFDDRLLCASCYEGCGSCCPEFGKDDLWEFPEQKRQDSSQPR